MNSLYFFEFPLENCFIAYPSGEQPVELVADLNSVHERAVSRVASCLHELVHGYGTIAGQHIPFHDQKAILKYKNSPVLSS